MYCKFVYNSISMYWKMCTAASVGAAKLCTATFLSTAKLCTATFILTENCVSQCLYVLQDCIKKHLYVLQKLYKTSICAVEFVYIMYLLQKLYNIYCTNCAQHVLLIVYSTCTAAEIVYNIYLFCRNSIQLEPAASLCILQRSMKRILFSEVFSASVCTSTATC